MDHFKLINKPKFISYSYYMYRLLFLILIVLTSCMLSAIIACGFLVLRVKQSARLSSKTTCSYTSVTSWQYSFYNTIARLIYT